ncbi:DNA-binding transcriptional activator PspC [Bacillus sp. THAF10]|uniref:PspC domain-containing protein n=1 Tax=Bacillus sp. THAF10 TaxID=2587848 RepID=UPI00126970C8|nr:PspC domain-containing protein [Bacillus sp. THAF10]QFT90599.1 DNA-binding transcriptional activator PspC [Bacillus sp. THAF10]
MKRLIRSKYDRKLAGVLGGLSKYLGVDSTLLRVIFIILLFPTGVMPLIITYFVLMFLMPNEEAEIR